MPYWNCPVCRERVDNENPLPCIHVKDILLLFKYTEWSKKYNKEYHIDNIEEFVKYLYKEN